MAVKRAKPGTSVGLLATFKVEVKLLIECDHPHVLPLLGYCLSEQAPCLISPLMRGGSLGLRLKPADANPSQLKLLGLVPPLRPLTWRQRLHAVCEAVEGLLYLHARSVWHRDFKPDNIFLDERLTAYLADTGFAKDTKAEATSIKSKSHMLYGSDG